MSSSHGPTPSGPAALPSHPDARIDGSETPFSRFLRVDVVRFRHRLGAGGAHPDQRAVGPAGLRQHRAAGIAAVQLQQDRAGVIVAARHDGNPDRSDIAAADQRLDPDAGLEPRLHRCCSALR